MKTLITLALSGYMFTSALTDFVTDYQATQDNRIEMIQEQTR